MQGNIAIPALTNTTRNKKATKAKKIKVSEKTEIIGNQSCNQRLAAKVKARTGRNSPIALLNKLRRAFLSLLSSGPLLTLLLTGERCINKGNFLWL